MLVIQIFKSLYILGLTTSDIESHPRYDDQPDATALVLVMYFLKSPLKVGKVRIRGERSDLSPIT